MFSLATVLLLASPLDCFSQLAVEKSSSCCAARHCNPAGQDRACCQVQLFGNSQYYQAAKKSSVPVPEPAAALVEPLPQFDLYFGIPISPVDFNQHAPPGGFTNTNLPLLI